MKVQRQNFLEWKVYSETPVFWYTRKEADENQDTTYIYTKDGLPLVVSYGHYKNAMEKAAKHAKKEALYAKELHELKKQLLHAKRIASESVKQASSQEKVTFSDQDFSKVTQGAKDSSVSQNASPPKSPTKKMKKVKSMTPEEKAKKKEAARKKKEEARKKKEEAKGRRKKLGGKKRNTTAFILRRRRLSMPW